MGAKAKPTCAVDRRHLNRDGNLWSLAAAKGS